MAVLEVNNLTHSFGDKLLYKNACFEIFKGEHMGIVGQNGTGKSTLLRSLIGEITPDSGDIRWQKNKKIGYLDQYAKIDDNKTVFEYLKTAFKDLYDIEHKLNEIYSNMMENFSDDVSQKASDYQSLLLNRGFYEIESNVLKVCDGLGITSIGVNSILKNLSGGQRAKVILAKLLLENPDVLLLDEPTNFLDKEHVEWLSDFLKNFKNNFMVISHDFEFLDKITNCILDIEFQKITKYTGNLSNFLKIKGIQKESYIKQYVSWKKEVKKLEDYIAKNRVRASTAKQAQSRMKKLEKMDKMVAPQNTVKPYFSFKCTPISSSKALKVHSLVVGYEKPLLPSLSFEVKSGEKIVITGFNGIGKTTVLKTLMGKIKPLSGTFKFADYVKINYFEQDLKWENDDLTPIQIVRENFPNFTEQEIRKQLAICAISSKNATQKLKTLSGGEQSKVKLCLLANRKSNFLIMDEPTNHLDVDSKEVLMEQLKKWEGNLILVSHEENFYSNWIDKIIDLKDYLN